MKKINYTTKEKSPHLLLQLSETALMSAYADLKGRSKYTKKWDEVLAKLEPLFKELNSLLSFLDYCKDRSAIPENELINDKKLVYNLASVLIHIDNKSIVDGLNFLGEKARTLQTNKH